MVPVERNGIQTESTTAADGRLTWRRMSREPGTTRIQREYRRSDAQIRQQLCQTLQEREDLDSSDVSIDVLEGMVALMGTVPVRWMKHAIEDLAADTPGVIDVENYLRVAGRAPPAKIRRA